MKEHGIAKSGESQALFMVAGLMPFHLTQDYVSAIISVSLKGRRVNPKVAYRSQSETRQGASDVVQHRLPTEGT
jgi:hypothetical protein